MNTKVTKTVKQEKKLVETIVEVPTIELTLSLNQNEVDALFEMTCFIGGDPDHSFRKTFAEIRELIRPHLSDTANKDINENAVESGGALDPKRCSPATYRFVNRKDEYPIMNFKKWPMPQSQ